MAQTYELVVGVRFTRGSKIYHFNATDFQPVDLNDYVIVETSKGRQIGEVVQVLHNFTVDGEPLKSIEGMATPRELDRKSVV